MRSILPATIAALLFLSASLRAQDSNLKDIKPPSDKDKKDVPDKHRGNETVNGRTLYEWTKLLRDKDASVCEQAIATLKVYGQDARPYASDVIRVMKNTQDISLKVNAVITLGWIGMEEKDLKDGLIALSTLLNNPEGIVRFQAVIALGNLGSKAYLYVDRMIPLLHDHRSWETRQATARALGQAGWGVALNGNPVFHLKAFAALVRALSDPCAEVRLEAIHALITLGAPAKPGDLAQEKIALQSLIHEKGDHQPKKIAIWARVALMRIDKVTETHLAPIRQELTSKELETRIEAAKALAIIGEPAHSCVDSLIAALEDKDPRVVFWSCYALARMGKYANGALAALERLTQHDDAAVKEIAGRAMEEIKGSVRARNDDVPQKKRGGNNKSQ
jgi:HEAT repeat protein